MIKVTIKNVLMLFIWEHCIIPFVTSKKPANIGFIKKCELMSKKFRSKTRLIRAEKNIENPQIIAIVLIEFLTQETKILETGWYSFSVIFIFSRGSPIELNVPK